MENGKVISAGGLVVKQQAGSLEVVLVGNGRPTIWRIPKGMQEMHEDILQTAIREVREESGIIGFPVGLIGTGTWTYEYEGRLWDETCYFYEFNYTAGDIDDHDQEHEFVAWFDINEAKKVLYYELEQNIVGELIHELNKKNR